MTIKEYLEKSRIELKINDAIFDDLIDEVLLDRQDENGEMHFNKSEAEQLIKELKTMYDHHISALSNVSGALLGIKHGLKTE